MHNPIKIGVVGCGYWGPNLIRNFRSLPDCQMQFMCEAHAADDSVDVVVSAFETSLREALDARAQGKIEALASAAMGAQSHSAAG